MFLLVIMKKCSIFVAKKKCMIFKGNNIILVGLPGAGKTTLGKIFAERLGMDFIDTDQYILDKFEKNWPGRVSFFARADWLVENYTTIIDDLLETKNSVIATGAEIVSALEMGKSLKPLGRVICIIRDSELILNDLENRSTLKFVNAKTGEPCPFFGTPNMLLDVYKKKMHLLLNESDESIINDGTIEDGVNKLIALLR